VIWTEEERLAFEKLRNLLLQSSVLTHPDWNLPFEVHTDACNHGLGAVLVQRINGVERVVCFASRSLTQSEIKYNTFELECLAAVWACEMWHSLYLYGRKFTLITDNEALTWLFGSHTGSPKSTINRVHKWIIQLQDLDYDAKHRKGEKHCNADGLSRVPLGSTAPYGEQPSEALYGMAKPIVCATQEGTVEASAIIGELGCPFFPPADKQAWNDEEWVQLQSEDKHCAKIINGLKDPKKQSLHILFFLDKAGVLRKKNRTRAQSENHGMAQKARKDVDMTTTSTEQPSQTPAAAAMDDDNPALAEQTRIDELARTLLKPTLDLHTTRRNGHCLFESISKGVYDDISNAPELRLAAVAYITKTRGQFGTCKAAWGIPDKTAREYTARMTTKADWGGLPEIMALGAVLKRKFTVHWLRGTKHKEQFVAETYLHDTDYDECHLVYVGDNHYHAATPTIQPSSSEIIAPKPTVTTPTVENVSTNDDDANATDKEHTIATAKVVQPEPTLFTGGDGKTPPHANTREPTPMSNTVRVVPRSLRAFVLHQAHGLPIAGHPNKTVTYDFIKRDYWWKGMTKHISKWISACTPCKRRKTPRPMKSGTPKSISAPYPGHTWSIDIQGPLPVTSTGKRYLLTMQCLCSRYPIAEPVPDVRASTLCDAIFKRLLCVHGRPAKMLTDRGRNLIGRAIKHLCSRWGIRKIETTGYQPQANPVERFHRYLNTAMTALHQQFGMEWDTYVDAALFVYRASKCESTGYSPYFLIHGREAVLPQSIFTPASPTDEFKSDSEHVTYTSTQLAAAYKSAFDQQVQTAARNAEARSKTMRQVTYTKGQKVLYWQPASKQTVSTSSAKTREEHESDQTDTRQQSESPLPSKWTSKWTGPHTIVGPSPTADDTSTTRPTANVYDVRHKATGAVFKANVNRLTPFRPWSKDIVSTSPLPDDDTGFKTAGDITVGSLVIIAFDTPITQTDGAPCIIGKVLNKDGDTGAIELQWLWNNQGSMMGKMSEGWINQNRKKPQWGTPSQATINKFKPWTTASEPTMKSPNVSDVRAHSFQLHNGKLPMQLLVHLSEDPDIDWELPKR
jgi:hypothetical protein